MKARPLTKAEADAIGTLVIERARDYQQRSRMNTSVGEVVYMRAACEELACTLLGAVCGTDQELELRRILGDRLRPAASFGPALRNEAIHLAGAAKRARDLQRLRSNLRTPTRRLIDHTHPKD